MSSVYHLNAITCSGDLLDEDPELPSWPDPTSWQICAHTLGPTAVIEEMRSAGLGGERALPGRICQDGGPAFQDGVRISATISLWVRGRILGRFGLQVGGRELEPKRVLYSGERVLFWVGSGFSQEGFPGWGTRVFFQGGARFSKKRHRRN